MRVVSRSAPARAVFVAMRVELQPQLAVLLGDEAFAWSRFVEWASRFMVSPAMATQLRFHRAWELAPAEVQGYFEGAAELAALRNAEQLQQVDELAETLNLFGVRPVFLKGVAALLTGLYSSPGDRISGDIDLLVPARHVRVTLEALEAQGYHPDPLGMEAFAARSGNDLSSASPEFRHYPRLYRSDRIAGVEVHATLFGNRLNQALPAEVVLASAQAVPRLGVDIAVPSDVHQLQHNILHAFDSEGFLLRGASKSLHQGADFARLARRITPVERAAVFDAIREAGYGYSLSLYLAYQQYWLGFKIESSPLRWWLIGWLHRRQTSMYFNRFARVGVHCLVRVHRTLRHPGRIRFWRRPGAFRRMGEGLVAEWSQRDKDNPNV